MQLTTRCCAQCPVKLTRPGSEESSLLQTKSSSGPKMAAVTSTNCLLGKHRLLNQKTAKSVSQKLYKRRRLKMLMEFCHSVQNVVKNDKIVSCIVYSSAVCLLASIFAVMSGKPKTAPFLLLSTALLTTQTSRSVPISSICLVTTL